jgi:hypothetical protein
MKRKHKASFLCECTAVAWVEMKCARNRNVFGPSKEKSNMQSLSIFFGLVSYPKFLIIKTQPSFQVQANIIMGRKPLTYPLKF